MLKKLITLGSLATALSFSTLAHAQANPTATRLSHVQIGGGYSYARTDYGQRGDKGLTVFADYDIGVHFGAEANYHHTSISTPDNVSEKSFTVGPRFILRKYHFRLYGKGFIGLGHINAPLTPVNRLVADETDFLIGGGGGVEYQLTDHLTIRPADVEYQRWSFKTGLTTIVLT
ncbi:MAG TPA: porin family protein, partial [Acidobacteriaceae bacterium]|nr:porin family protein [Acidobacteriaceae bacterium]